MRYAVLSTNDGTHWEIETDDLQEALNYFEFLRTQTPCVLVQIMLESS